MKTSKQMGIAAAALFGVLAMVHPAQASSIPITYGFAGVGTVNSATDTTLTLDVTALGSITSGNPALNAAWNPVTFTEQCVLDLTTGFLTGNFTMSLEDGDTLTGTDFEDDSATLTTPDGTGPFTQTLTFTDGTGAFAGATGSVSGSGFIGLTSFTDSGSGTVNTAAAPEPASAAFLLGGLALIVTARLRGHR